MKRIPLTHEQFALVDDEDYQELSKYKWQAMWNASTQSYYARRKERGADGNRRDVRMHRYIMGAKRSEIVDHENHNTLDNRRVNLRVCSLQQNNANSRVTSNISGFKGVSWSKGNKKWQVRVREGQGKRRYIGMFQEAVDAARAYDAEATRVFGEFAMTNEKMGLLPRESP